MNSYRLLASRWRLGGIVFRRGNPRGRWPRRRDTGVRDWLAVVWIALFWAVAARPSAVAAAGIPLEAVRVPGGLEVAWTAVSVTPSAPYLHYEYQVEVSSNLVHWERFGAAIPGGVRPAAAIPERVRVTNGLATASAASSTFVRLNYRLRFPGGNLSGVSLEGIDLTGGDLSGANLAGANFAGASVEGLRLDGAALGGVSFRDSTGTPVLSVLGGGPGDSASLSVPRLRYRPQAVDYPAAPESGLTSSRIVAAGVRPTATVGAFNAALAAAGGRIVGSIPGVTNGPGALLTLKLPTTEATVDGAMAGLSGSGVFDLVTRDLVGQGAGLPAEQGGVAGEADWVWSLPAAGGNWGFELMGVPQMWNFDEALRKRQGGVGPTVLVGVVEGGMVAGHEDLGFTLVSTNAGVPSVGDMGHGAHVTGTIGALHGNGLGVQGVSPFVRLNVETPGSAPATEQWQRDAVEDLAYRGARVVNISIAIPWGAVTNNPGTNAPMQAALNTSGDAAVRVLGLIAGKGWQPIVCVAAGNESDSPNLAGADVDAIWASGWANAALRGLAGNVFVIEAAGAADYSAVQPGDLSRRAFSNINGQMAAPGENVLSAYHPARYAPLAGTSMATPHVTGLIAYLLALDPGLTAPDVAALLMDRTLPVAGTSAPFVQAWPSALGIDDLRNNKTLLQMLLDLDDGTVDGNLRVTVPASDPARDRAFAPVSAFPLGLGVEFEGDDADGDGGPGDGRIDMADFRRWRDWLLADEVIPPSTVPEHALNGGVAHPKRDANRDGRVTANETALFPRGDFNGDGWMNRQDAVEQAGALNGLGALTDLEVLTRSGLWQDAQYSVFDLPYLIDSVDLTVIADNFFQRNPAAAGVAGEVTVYDAGTRSPLAFGLPVGMSEVERVRVFTSPVGRPVYVASGPIALADGTNVMMRSVGDLASGQAQRGADYAVDLALVEMTGVAGVTELGLREIDSEPDATEIDAFIEGDNGFESTFGHEYAGSRAWANDQGTFYALARSGQILNQPSFEGSNTFTAGVRWQRSFVKEAGVADPTYLVKPLELALIGGGFLGEELVAAAEILVEVRSAASPEWTTNFHQAAEIAGAATGFGPATFRIVREEGMLPPKPLVLEGSPASGATYTQEAYDGEISLQGLQPGDSFEVRYTLTARAVAHGLDQYAAAWVGDPLDYGSGLRMEYGSYGELPKVLEASATPSGPVVLTHRSRTNFYYLLFRRDVPGGARVPVALSLGTNGLGTLVDPNPLPSTEPGGAPEAWRYEIENQPIDRPLDTDGDGMDDVYELQHPGLLQPLDPTDALEDADGDRRTNWREYLDGTDPAVADPSRPARVDLYPGRVLPLGEAGPLAADDLNQDGEVDYVSLTGDAQGLQSSLGEGGGWFLPPIVSALPAGGSYGGIVVARLNADVFPDVVVLDVVRHQLLVLLGGSDGRFQLHQTLGTTNFPERIVPGDFGNDGVIDLAVISGGSRGVALYAGQGDGSFQSRPGIAFGPRPDDAVLADLDGNGLAELAVTLSSAQVAILPGLGNGAFGAPQFVEVGFDPGSVVTARLNGDAHPDLIVANQSTDDLSILLGNGNNTFQPQVRVLVGDAPQGLAVVDANADGRDDVIVSHLGSPYHLVLPGTGAGGFAPAIRVDTERAEQFLALDAGDDGRVDLLVPVSGGHAMFMGLGDGRFESRTDVWIPRLSPVDLELADWNGDGRPDLAVANQRSNSVEVLLGQVGGGFGPFVTVPVGRSVIAMVSGRFDADANVDLAVVTARAAFSPAGSSNQLHVLRGNGAGGFTPLLPLALAGVPGDVLTGDLDGDGVADLLVIHFEDGKAAPFLGQGDGTFVARPLLDLGGASYSQALRDLNGDGRADLVCAPLLGDRYGVRIFHAGPGGTLVQAQEIALPDGESVNGLALRELTGDGRVDLVLIQAGPDGAHLGIQAGLADGTFAAGERLALEGYGGGVVEFADVNGDGRLDVVSGGTIWLGQAGGGYGSPEVYWLGGTLPVLVADVTGDGQLDLITADDTTDAVRVLRHR